MDRQNSDDIVRFLDGMASSDDVLFGFLDEGNQSPEDFPDSGNLNGGGDIDDVDDNSNCNPEVNKAFWQEQEKLLQVLFFLLSKSSKSQFLVSRFIRGSKVVWDCVGDTV